jgi:hypothetical protein
MIRIKSQYNSIQLIPKTVAEQPIKKNDTKLTYEEIRKIVEHTGEKEVQVNPAPKQIKNKFAIV